ncbi:MAG: hypothetical protein KAU28_11165, partial [Phycisphaerae bacterium]|nr:hypothetical protein [Phycisphaerae bacterium]
LADSYGKKLKELGVTAKKVGKDESDLGKMRQRVLQQIMTPQDRYNQKVKELDRLLKAGKLTQQQYNTAVGQAKQKLQQHNAVVGQTKRKFDDAGAAGKRAFGSEARRMVTSLAGALGLGVGLAGAVGAIRKAYQGWLQDIKDVNVASNKLQDDISSFAAMMPAGQKRAETIAAGKFIAAHGVEQKVGFDVMQAMRSGFGKEKGRLISAKIFQAQRIGIPAALGQELETTGGAAGMAPGEAIRFAYVAGQASKRDPAMLALAPKGATFWRDKRLAFAAAGPLAAQYGTEMPTYLKAGGIGLSMETGKAVQEKYIEMGLGLGATQRERYEALHKMGLRTTEELSQ